MTPSNALRGLLVAGLVSASALQGGTREFKHLVKDLRTHCHKAPTGTGFLGLMARCFAPEGIRGLRMAIFEDLEERDRMPGAAFEDLVRRTMGPELTPLVLVRSQRLGERTLIYAKPHGQRADLLIATAEEHEMVVLSLEVDPEQLQTWLNDPARLGERARGEKEPEAVASGGGSVPEVDLVR